MMNVSQLLLWQYHWYAVLSLHNQLVKPKSVMMFHLELADQAQSTASLDVDILFGIDLE